MRTNESLTIIVFIFCLILLIANIYIDHNKTLYCKVHKPQFNISLDNDNVAFCYSEGWKDYCKIRYPNNCPKEVE